MTSANAVLMPHQLEGVSFLIERGSGLLAFEQGLGKTLVAIEGFLSVRESSDSEFMLVLCPNSLKRNWLQELQHFAPSLDAEIIRGTRRQRRERLAKTDAQVVVMNYESARAEVTALRALLTRRKGVLVLDESHMAKNRRSLTSIAARNLAELSTNTWLLTGTPVTNSAEDMHTQIELVAGSSALGSADAFVVRYGGRDVTSAALEELAAKVAPFVLRRRKEDCLDLPEKSFVDIYVPLPAWQRSLYDSVRDGLIGEIKAMSQHEFRTFAGTALTRLLRLSQIASNPSLVGLGSDRTPAKYRELDGVLGELVGQNGRKVIVWSQYVATIEQLVERYEEFGAAAIYGGVPAEERQLIAERFQSDPTAKILVANPAAAGMGFTLTAASYTIYETLNWRYDHYAQSQDRNHRIGQSMPVTYLRLLAEDTIDEVILEALERKARMAGTIVGDAPEMLDVAAMAPTDFCEMLRTNRIPS